MAHTGIGSFGSVYKADYRGQEVAAKILNSQMHAKQIEEFKRYSCSPSLNSPLRVQLTLSLRREVNILNRLRCPYVLNFIGASHVEGKRCIVTELCKFGSVGDLVFSDKSFNYLLMLKVALDMSKAISFLHGYPTSTPDFGARKESRLTNFCYYIETESCTVISSRRTS